MLLFKLLFICYYSNFESAEFPIREGRRVRVVEVEPLIMFAKGATLVLLVAFLTATSEGGKVAIDLDPSGLDRFGLDPYSFSSEDAYLEAIAHHFVQRRIQTARKSRLQRWLADEQSSKGAGGLSEGSHHLVGRDAK